MAKLLRTWLPSVGTCLLLQATIVMAGVQVNRWVENPSPPASTGLERPSP